LIKSAEDDWNIYSKFNTKSLNKKVTEKRKKMKEISNKKLEDAYSAAQNICKEYEKENEIFLKILGFAKNGNYVQIPVIKNNKWIKIGKKNKNAELWI